MRAPIRPLALVLALVLVIAGCTMSTSSSGSRSSSSPSRSTSSVRCLDPGGRGGQGAYASSDEPDRPIFFFFCTQSP
jgi:hypothetical protein